VQGKTSSAPLGPSRTYVELLAANIIRLRGELGWTTRAFAEHAGLELKTLYEVEHAVYRTISIDTVDRFARAFGVHPAMLVAPPSRRRAFPDVPTRDTLAANIVQAREARRWTQAQLAEHAGVSRTLIAHVERRSRNVSLDVLERIGRAVALTLPEMLTAKSEHEERHGLPPPAG
jgi:transcriptional regulator with XRE-family HTH domain